MSEHDFLATLTFHLLPQPEALVHARETLLEQHPTATGTATLAVPKPDKMLSAAVVPIFRDFPVSELFAMLDVGPPGTTIAMRRRPSPKLRRA